MNPEQRKQVEDIVTVQLANAMQPVLRAQAETRERLIGIDGNGTGREGALQRQDKKLVEMSGQIEDVKTSVSTLVERSETVSKKKIWELAQWAIGGLGAFATVIAGMWLGHALGWVH